MISNFANGYAYLYLSGGAQECRLNDERCKDPLNLAETELFIELLLWHQNYNWRAGGRVAICQPT